MSREKAPVSAAVRELRRAEVSFSDHLYRYEEEGEGLLHPRASLALTNTPSIKDIDKWRMNTKKPLVVLMHGDMQVSTKELARIIGAKQVSPCSPETANRHSGYLTGGTSPFGLKRKMPIYMEESILKLEIVYINGGSRGYLVGLSPLEMSRVLEPVVVTVGISG